jgi:hypothetical protein
MSVKEIETAVAKLAPVELAAFAEWFEEYQARLWDAQIAADAKAGRLDELIREANKDFEAGRCKPL